MSDYRTIGRDVGLLVECKQIQYGNSTGRTGAILRTYFPDGIRPHQYDDLLLMVRIMDKLSRLASRPEGKSDLGGESPYRDIAGYGLLGIAQDARSSPEAQVSEAELEFVGEATRAYPPAFNPRNPQGGSTEN